MTDLNTYLKDAGIDPAQTALCFHRPVERAFSHFLPQLLVDETALFEAYQSTYSDRATSLLAKRKYLASFVGHPSGWAVFAGVFRIDGHWQRPVSEIADIPAIQRLYDEFGVCSEFFEGVTQSWQWFDLVRLDAMDDLRGRLEVTPPDSGSYVRGAESESIAVVAVRPSSTLNLPLPDWRDLVLWAREVQVLPKSWATEMQSWRGVYMITDERDGARFVASSTGTDLLSAWRAHLAKAAKGSGVKEPKNKEPDNKAPEKLRKRDPMQFRFSILEMVDADCSDEALAAKTTSWIRRLHTQKFGLNDA